MATPANLQPPISKRLARRSADTKLSPRPVRGDRSPWETGTPPDNPGRPARLSGER